MSAPVDVLKAMRIAEAYCYDAGASNAAQNMKAASAAVAPAERTELLRAIEECANQARDLADKYGIPSLLVAVTRLHEAADIVEAA